MYSTPLVVSKEKKECLAKVLEVFENLQESDEIAKVLHLHDELSHLLEANDIEIEESVSRYFMKLRVERINDNKSPTEKELEDNWKKRLFEYLAIEADLYRAMGLTSIHLMQRIPMVHPLSEQDQEDLRSCIQRSQLLLKIIDQRIQSALDPDHQDETEMNNLLEHYTTEYHESLEGWLLQYDQEEEDDNHIAFDKEQLQMEEEELLHMAATPTPNEAETTMSVDLHKDMTARLIQCNVNNRNDAETDTTVDNISSKSQYSGLVIWNDQQGVFRSPHPQEQAWWWLVTSESLVQCNAATITISSVYTNRPQLVLLSSVQLQVTEDPSLWWSRISRFVQSLQESKELQTELTTLWPSTAMEQRLQQARTIISTN